MTDLKAELNHRHTGEDDCTTIMRRCERHCNLDSDYDSLRAAPARHATHFPRSPGATDGCMALAPHLRMLVWSRKFLPHLSEKYDEPVNPAKVPTDLLHLHPHYRRE
jgi:hypothetical protein